MPIGNDVLTVTGAIAATNGTTIDLGAGDDTVGIERHAQSIMPKNLDQIAAAAPEM
ncbi:hypothetical protein [Bradyrhizobium vignae]|uniref:hypothetical protein n=1 Tax=Bradyrhizobium vignae TaxID=1549949 RepID=UPI001FD867A3|nr:hypothetical protein [Bradyrhizobium vignae]